MKLLLAEDNAVNQTLAIRMLEELGYSAMNGKNFHAIG
jgi:CheY-like chemotaxis protein